MRICPNWVAWPQAQWDAWLAKSQQLVNELALLDAKGKREERNVLIDANSVHWGELRALVAGAVSWEMLVL